MWDDKSHGSLSDRSVTRATGNKIDSDKHRLTAHTCANAVQTQMPAQTSHRYREHHHISCVYIHIIITRKHAHRHNHS